MILGNKTSKLRLESKITNYKKKTVLNETFKISISYSLGDENFPQRKQAWSMQIMLYEVQLLFS